jgi:hypothetical protein
MRDSEVVLFLGLFFHLSRYVDKRSLGIGQFRYWDDPSHISTYGREENRLRQFGNGKASIAAANACPDALKAAAASAFMLASSATLTRKPCWFPLAMIKARTSFRPRRDVNVSDSACLLAISKQKGLSRVSKATPESIDSGNVPIFIEFFFSDGIAYEASEECRRRKTWPIALRGSRPSIPPRSYDGNGSFKSLSLVRCAYGRPLSGQL